MSNIRETANLRASMKRVRQQFVREMQSFQHEYDSNDENFSTSHRRRHSENAILRESVKNYNNAGHRANYKHTDGVYSISNGIYSNNYKNNDNPCSIEYDKNYADVVISYDERIFPRASEDYKKYNFRSNNYRQYGGQRNFKQYQNNDRQAFDNSRTYNEKAKKYRKQYSEVQSRLSSETIGQYKIIHLNEADKDNSQCKWLDPLVTGYQEFSKDSALATVVAVEPDGPYKVIKVQKHDFDGNNVFNRFNYYNKNFVNQLQNSIYVKGNAISDIDSFAQKQRLIEIRNNAALNEITTIGERMQKLKFYKISSDANSSDNEK